ncbi:MAG: Gfo/Idh/MocA family oxidoreductase [Chloroflexi bacterium]|nr:Gfo/Idh/MocA family oxidoreductase [Chloroflexota bacterium]
MSVNTIRIGIVGAGANTRLHHIPGFKAIEGVEVVSVCNRSRESSQRVADEYGIPKIYDHWTELVRAADTDAICIGTWPYLHCPVTLAALDADKHVLTEARMAMDATQARAMRDAARTKPYLVTQIVPAPTTLKHDRTIKDLIAEGYLGDILAVELQGSGSSFVDRESPIRWRQEQDLSGYNILNMGIWYETLMRWVGPAVKVQAMAEVNTKRRRDAEGQLRTVTVPDHVDILCRMACGAQAHLRFSAVMGHSRAPEVWLFGSEGTLHLDIGSDVLMGGRRADGQLSEISIPPEKQGGWRVEEEFINAIRGKEQVTHTSFEDGVKYMEFTEAVTRSAQTGRAISLPL